MTEADERLARQIVLSELKHDLKCSKRPKKVSLTIIYDMHAKFLKNSLQEVETCIRTLAQIEHRPQDKRNHQDFIWLDEAVRFALIIVLSKIVCVIMFKNLRYVYKYKCLFCLFKFIKHNKTCSVCVCVLFYIWFFFQYFR